MTDPKPLKALALNGTLKPTGKDEPSSTEVMIKLVLDEMADFGVEGQIVRLADHDIRPGVSSDEGDGDAWPAIRRHILDADILIAGSPVWMGQPGSVIKRACERMDAFLSETDDEGRLVTYGKAAMVAVVGNEDGAHHVSAELYQALNDVGFSLGPNAVAYWVGEAMNAKDFRDFDTPPDTVLKAVRMAARGTMHLARLLKANPYPSIK